MKKNKLFIFIVILTLVCLVSFTALCNQCSLVDESLTKEEPPEEEPPDEEPPDEEPLEEEPPEEEPLEEEPLDEEPPEEEPPDEELSEPTIDLEIYEGPIYSEADWVCYYRIKAIVTGNPNPEVEFSRDDSGGSWGTTKCQINLHDPSETYNLTATATNPEGTASDSIELSWGCEEEIIEEEEGPNIVKLQPEHIGYIVYPSGINSTTLIIGDSISNTDVRGYFAFDLSPIRGKTVETMTLTLENPIKYGEPEIFKGKIYLCVITSYLPLDADDYDSIPSPTGWRSYENYTDPIIFEMGEYSMGFALLQSIVDAGGKLECSIKYKNDSSDGDFVKDGREYKRGNIILRILYTD